MTDESRRPQVPARRPEPGQGAAATTDQPGAGLDQWALLFEHAPVALILVDEDRRVLALNRDAALLAGPMPREMLGRIAGLALGCANSEQHPDGCGHGQACASCGFRQIIAETFRSGTRQDQVEISACFGQRSGDSARRLLVSTSRIEFHGHRRTLLAIQQITAPARLEPPPPLMIG